MTTSITIHGYDRAAGKPVALEVARSELIEIITELLPDVELPTSAQTSCGFDYSITTSEHEQEATEMAEDAASYNNNYKRVMQLCDLVGFMPKSDRDAIVNSADPVARFLEWLIPYKRRWELDQTLAMRCLQQHGVPVQLPEVKSCVEQVCDHSATLSAKLALR